ncbi:divalent-cation tolerance protein CutA [bacterium]|nr:divalent-cation tolerance protein CutA [bacterium]
MVTTVATEEEAVRIASAVVEAGLAACVHVEEIRSIYAWDGALQDEPEVRLTMKTVPARADELERCIHAKHSYDTPMILRRAALGINAGYLDWARRCTGAGGKGCGEGDHR